MKEPGADSRSAEVCAPTLGSLLLTLHRIGREAPYRAFQPATLEAIQSVIPFDSAWWGNAAAEPLEIHRLHLHNCASTILADYEPYMSCDFFREALMNSPGRTINMSDLTTRARYVRTPLYREVGRFYRVEWSLGTLMVEPVSSLNEFLTLWRHDPGRPFTEVERRTKEILMPHVVEAHRHARLRDVLGEADARRDRWAIVDGRGFLREASPGFVHAVREHWPQWHGSQLPADLVARPPSPSPARESPWRLRWMERGEFRYLEILAPSPLDRLSARERMVCELYADGRTRAEVATALAITPTTVRNHVASSFRKLGVRNRTELLARLKQL